ncbi:MAG: hypothetical protein CMQ21_06175 [Gammaproteobacteria bacterium]|nr:hypothetical protein [Gammaproteobacteria bacterium]
MFTEPDFSADTPAFCYVRVFKDPTCRWSTLLANGAGVEPPDDMPATFNSAAGLRRPGWHQSNDL